MTPFDPRSVALDVLASMHWPAIGDRPEREIAALTDYLRAEYHAGAVAAENGIATACTPVALAAKAAWHAGRDGRPLVPWA